MIMFLIDRLAVVYILMHSTLFHSFHIHFSLISASLEVSAVQGRLPAEESVCKSAEAAFGSPSWGNC